LSPQQEKGANPQATLEPARVTLGCLKARREPCWGLSRSSHLVQGCTRLQGVEER
uniref:Uncharacterized protein n=1 Tax=Zonotrichia albicollis TaxID=44394 RepID=A0A8D2M0H8_ZONAL